LLLAVVDVVVVKREMSAEEHHHKTKRASNCIHGDSSDPWIGIRRRLALKQ
jgi:hypothetical protein